MLLIFKIFLFSDVAEAPKQGGMTQGQTGAALLAAGLTATAVSKEMIVLDADVRDNFSVFCNDVGNITRAPAPIGIPFQQRKELWKRERGAQPGTT